MEFDPLIVTLELDAATTARFEAERRELFPAGRTAVGAHLTLFHALPGRLTSEVLTDVAEAAARPAFDVAVRSVISLGRGAAYQVGAPELSALQRGLQRLWAEHLTRQDSQGFRGHVTVQNKVSSDVAKATVERLRAAFVPFVARAEGLAVWRYVGGPWEPVQRFDFE